MSPDRSDAARVELLLEAARYLGETLELGRVYDRFHELLAGSIPHDGVVVSSWNADEGLIRCEYAWVEGNRVDPETLPPLPLNPKGGMQSEVIVSGEARLINNVQERVTGSGTYYNVDREGTIRKVPDTGPPGTQAAMMVPVKLEGRVVGIVQLMNDQGLYTDEQLRLVEGLVGQMAAAIRNARLHKAAQIETAARVRAEAVAAEREQAAKVLEAVGEGIFLLDDSGFVRLWNRAAELITGTMADEAIDRRIAKSLPGWDTIATQIPVTRAGSTVRPVTLPLELGGAELWLSFVAVRSAEGVVYAFRDLTSERGLDQAKSEFIATVSHELRTPMAGIYGAAQTLLRQDVEFSREQQRALLEIIANQATRLSQITEEVLVASRLDSGELSVQREQVDVAQLAAETVETIRPQVPETIDVELDADAASGRAFGDRSRLEQVVVNLLDNAIKYSPDGGRVVVSVHRRPTTVRLSVADEGLGIPPAEQQRVFEKFYRLDTQVAQSGGGTGLGLYICRELVRRMGGTIALRSEPGLGSTFSVDLQPAEDALDSRA